MWSWRHSYIYMLHVRLLIIVVPVGLLIINYGLFPMPRNKLALKDLEHAYHHLECCDHNMRQNEQDKIYFQKYDPLRNVRHLMSH